MIFRELSLAEQATLLCEFMEVFIHTLLKERQIYPPDLFEERIKYQIPVWRARMPQLSDYIFTLLQGLQPWIESQKLDKINIDFVKSDSRAKYESFSISFKTIGKGRDCTIEELFEGKYLMGTFFVLAFLWN
eukprot:TRINITY_DN4648_c0_g1_i4.p1 TRINITY_DN4648_c0_g1~~TRINITY_DN4648_c0_g1_i4.p1  ORF type:complete len:132 (-),score=11.20 TRINITY_DN4648_c0_g1_i4:88-483(-)